MERVFSFGGSALNASGSVAGLQCGLGKAEKLFSGERVSRFASANLNLYFVRAGEGSGEALAFARTYFSKNTEEGE